jgi:hypothetical protein
LTRHWWYFTVGTSFTWRSRSIGALKRFETCKWIIRSCWSCPWGTYRSSRTNKSSWSSYGRGPVRAIIWRGRYTRGCTPIRTYSRRSCTRWVAAAVRANWKRSWTRWIAASVRADRRNVVETRRGLCLSLGIRRANRSRAFTRWCRPVRANRRRSYTRCFCPVRANRRRSWTSWVWCRSVWASDRSTRTRNIGEFRLAIRAYLSNFARRGSGAVRACRARSLRACRFCWRASTVL